MWMKNKQLNGEGPQSWQIRSTGPEILALQMQEVSCGLGKAPGSFAPGGYMKRIRFAAVTVMALFLLLTLGAPSALAQFTFTSCHATSGCVPGDTYGTVDLTTNANGSITVDVVLTGGSYFVETGAGADSLFLFNAVSGATVSNMSATFNTTDVTSTLGGLTFTNHSPSTVMADGTGDWSGSIACTTLANCNGSSGTQKINDLHFTVTGETYAQLTSLNDGSNIFVTDVAIFGNGANTGDVDVHPLPSVPDGGMTLMLLGGALVCLEGLRRRVRA
jgi:hypothetical protein